MAGTIDDDVVATSHRATGYPANEGLRLDALKHSSTNTTADSNVWHKSAACSQRRE